MTHILEEAQVRFQKDFLSPSHEWDYIEALIKKSETERLPLLHWIFEKSFAYWDTRARAGMILLQENEIETWQIIKNLVSSANPDDNGTALVLFERTRDPRGLEMAQDWLNDGVHPVTQLEAIEFLKHTYPQKALSHARTLIHHKDLKIQNAARRLIDELTS